MFYRLILSCFLSLLIHSGIHANQIDDKEIANLLSLQLEPIEAKPWRFDGFPILAWWPPPGNTTPVDFQNYKDAGFTIYTANPDEGFEKAIEMAEQAGLNIMVFRTPQGFGLKSKKVDFPEDNKHVVGWITSDEPHSPEDVIQSIRGVHTLMQKDPTRRALFNLFPPFAQGEPGTEKIIDVAVRNGLPVISYDHYIMMADGSTREQAHFDYLEMFRKKSLEHNVPFWAFALTIEHYRYRRPSESDVRWKWEFF